jgi:hypothetical protein
VVSRGLTLLSVVFRGLPSDLSFLLCSEDFRLTKGDKGTLFVVARVKTDVLADKGAGRSKAKE